MAEAWTGPRLAKLAATVIIAAIGGGLGALAGLPAAWLSGAMIATTAASLAGFDTRLPLRLVDVVFLVIGITLGAGVSPEVVAGVAAWPISLAGLFLSVGACIYGGAGLPRPCCRLGPRHRLLRGRSRRSLLCPCRRVADPRRHAQGRGQPERPDLPARGAPAEPHHGARTGQGRVRRRRSSPTPGEIADPLRRRARRRASSSARSGAGAAAHRRPRRERRPPRHGLGRRHPAEAAGHRRLRAPRRAGRQPLRRHQPALSPGACCSPRSAPSSLPQSIAGAIALAVAWLAGIAGRTRSSSPSRRAGSTR